MWGVFGGWDPGGGGGDGREEGQGGGGRRRRCGLLPERKGTAEELAQTLIRALTGSLQRLESLG